MKVFTVCGIKASGKTTVCTMLISELCRRGYNVGSLKDIHFEDFHMDFEGSNSDLHKKAGAEPVVARGLHETNLMYKSSLPIDRITEFYDCDYLVLEGVYEAECPKILTAHTTVEIDERMTDKVFMISGRIADTIDEYNGLPALSPMTDIAAMADLIEKTVGEYKPEKLAKLFVNGVEKKLSYAAARELALLMDENNEIKVELKK